MFVQQLLKFIEDSSPEQSVLEEALAEMQVICLSSLVTRASHLRQAILAHLNGLPSGTWPMFLWSHASIIVALYTMDFQLAELGP